MGATSLLDENRNIIQGGQLVSTDDIGRKTFQDIVTNKIVLRGRWYLYADSRWVGARLVANNQNHNQNHGTGAFPNIDWRSLGIGVLPANTILLKLCMFGRTNNAQVGDMQLALNLQGDFDTDGGYGTNLEANPTELIAPTNLNVPDSAGTIHPMTNMRYYEIDLGEHFLDRQQAIVPTVKPIDSTLTATRYFYGDIWVEYT